MSEIHIIALLYPKSGQEAKAQELLNKMCKDVHSNEPDASRYLMTTATNTDEPTIVMVEKYKDKDTADAHLQTHYFKDLFAQFEKEGVMAKEAQLFINKATGGFDLDRKLI